MIFNVYKKGCHVLVVKHSISQVSTTTYGFKYEDQIFTSSLYGTFVLPWGLSRWQPKKELLQAILPSSRGHY